MNIDIASVIDSLKAFATDDAAPLSISTASLIFSILLNVCQFIRGRSARAKIRRLEGFDINKQLATLRLERDDFERKHSIELEELKGNEYGRVKSRLQALGEKQQHEIKKNQLEIEHLERILAEKKLQK